MGGSPLPTRLPGQARLALRTGSMSPKSYSLSPDWLQSPPPSLLPLAPPNPPLGLPSNCGRVAEIFSLLQAKARQHHGPRTGAGWGLGRGRPVFWGEPHYLGVLWAWTVGRLRAPEKVENGREWWDGQVHTQGSRPRKVERSSPSPSPSPSPPSPVSPSPVTHQLYFQAKSLPTSGSKFPPRQNGNNDVYYYLI